MANASPRIVLSEIKVPVKDSTVSLMKWQRVGPDSKPQTTVYLRRQFKGEDSLERMKLDQKISQLDVEGLLKLKETDIQSLGPKDMELLKRLQDFEMRQSVAQQEFRREEEKELLKRIHEGRPSIV